MSAWEAPAQPKLNYFRAGGLPALPTESAFWWASVYLVLGCTVDDRAAGLAPFQCLTLPSSVSMVMPPRL